MIGTKVSDPDTQDLDAFLPPELRIRDVLKKTSHEKRSAPEAIVEIPDSPFSMRLKIMIFPLFVELNNWKTLNSQFCTFSLARSGESVFRSDWTYPELQALLAVRWEECGDTRALKLSDLVPPENTSPLDAATCFTLLLGEYFLSHLKNHVQSEIYFSPIFFNAITLKYL